MVSRSASMGRPALSTSRRGTSPAVSSISSRSRLRRARGGGGYVAGLLPLELVQDRLLALEHDDALDQVLELADVAGEVVASKARARRWTARVWGLW